MTTQELVLACIMMKKRIYEELMAEGLTAEMFEGKNRAIFNKIVDYRLTNDIDSIPLQAIPLDDEVRARDLATLIDFKENEDWIYYLTYFESLKKEYYKREITENIIKINDYNESNIYDFIEKISSIISKKKNYTFSMENLIKEVEEEIYKRLEDSFENKYKTGFSDYDQMGHFEPSSLLIIAGLSGMGKSSFALNLAYTWLRRGLKVLYITYEMSKMICLSKLVVIRSGIHWNKAFATKGIKMDSDEFYNFIDALSWFKDKPLIINEIAESPIDVELLVKKTKSDVFIIDTVNFLTTDEPQFWLKLGNLANAYKQIARRNNCLGVMLAQAAFCVGRPTNKTGLGEAKRMKNAADYIDFVYRQYEEDPVQCPPELENIMEIYRLKGRLTGIGWCYLYFDGNNSQVRILTDWEKDRVKEILKVKKGKNKNNDKLKEDKQWL